MEVAERWQLLRASEKPLRVTGSGQEAASGEPGSIDPAAGENGHRGAERRIVRRSCLRSSMPCMPVGSQAGNQITWNESHEKAALVGALNLGVFLDYGEGGFPAPRVQPLSVR